MRTRARRHLVLRACQAVLSTALFPKYLATDIRPRPTVAIHLQATEDSDAPVGSASAGGRRCACARVVNDQFPGQRQLGSAWRISCGVTAILLCVVSVGLPLAQIVFALRTWAELPGAIDASAGTIWNSFWFAAIAATVVVSVALVLCSHRREEAET